MNKSLVIGFLVSVLCLSVTVLAYGEGSIGVNVVTPQYNFDLSSAGAMKSSMHFSKDGNDVGGWITSVADNNFFVSSGAIWDSSQGGWVQKSADGLAVMAGSGNTGYRILMRSGCPQGTVCPVTEPLRISFNGNVGIGTTNPQGKLDVNGPIYQRGGILHADYVFEPKYIMESIEKHAQHMWENKHLPAIARAKKDENGKEIIEIGAHQRGIVEELEKAHIYIEQLNNRLKALETKLNALEQK